MSAPLPRWYRERCEHERVEVRDGLGTLIRDYCTKCGARWKG